MFKESSTPMAQETQSLLEKNYHHQMLRAQNESKKLELQERHKKIRE